MLECGAFNDNHLAALPLSASHTSPTNLQDRAWPNRNLCTGIRCMQKIYGSCCHRDWNCCAATTYSQFRRLWNRHKWLAALSLSLSLCISMNELMHDAGQFVAIVVCIMLIIIIIIVIGFRFAFGVACTRAYVCLFAVR